MNKQEFLNLGRQPIANKFITAEDISSEFFYDLKVGFDNETKLVTHMEYVDPPLMFNENYTSCFEDVELNINCLLRGLKNFTNSDCVAYHYESQTRDDDNQKMNKLHFDYYNYLLPLIQKNINVLQRYLIVLN